MNVLTLNTHSWMEENPLDKIEQLAAQIITADYDLIALQEINQRTDSKHVSPDSFFHPLKEQMKTHEDNFALLLIQKLSATGHHYHWSWAYNHIGYAVYQEGVALLSKEPIQPEAILISQTNDPTDYHRRVLLSGKTRIDSHEITALSCHYSWWDGNEGFAQEWSKTEAYLETTQKSLLLMGDFNNPADQKNEGYQLIRNSPLHLKDSCKTSLQTSGEYTVQKEIDGWKNNSQDLRIDYLFTSSDIRVLTHTVLFNGETTPIISDHFGIEAKLSL